MKVQTTQEVLDRLRQESPYYLEQYLRVVFSEEEQKQLNLYLQGKATFPQEIGDKHDKSIGPYLCVKE